jgi:hypothetical protein
LLHFAIEGSQVLTNANASMQSGRMGFHKLWSFMGTEFVD